MNKNTRELVAEVTAGIGIFCLILEAATAAVFWLGPFSFGKTYIQIALGFLAGGLLAAGIFWHMGISAEGMLEQNADKKRRLLPLVRTLAVLAAMILLYLTGYVNLLSLFGGMMTLKAAAYAQPLIHKFLRKEGQT